MKPLFDNDGLQKELQEYKKEFQDYKKFAFSRNMVMVAIGLILATAFQKTVAGVSDYLIMPIINYFLSSAGGDWRKWIFQPVPGMNIEVGHLTGCFIDFFILSFILFFVYTKILKKIWPDEDLSGTTTTNSSTIGIETIYLKRDDKGNWKVL